MAWEKLGKTAEQIKDIIDGSSIASISITDSFTDPGGKEHTGELADSTNTLTYLGEERPNASSSRFESAFYDFMNSEISLEGSGGDTTIDFSNLSWNPQSGDILQTYYDGGEEWTYVKAYRP